MKLNWKELGKALWAAIKPMLLGAIGGAIYYLWLYEKYDKPRA